MLPILVLFVFLEPNCKTRKLFQQIVYIIVRKNLNVRCHLGIFKCEISLEGFFKIEVSLEEILRVCWNHNPSLRV